jgi:hypothetical protein
MRLFSTILFTLLITVSAAAAPIFTGPLDVANWTLTINDGDGSVDLTGAPDLIILFGSDGDQEADNVYLTTFSITNTTGVPIPFSFDWFYSTQDGESAFDPFGYFVNSTFTQLTNNTLLDQSGSVALVINPNDVFGFYTDAGDNCCGGSTTVISGVPEPHTYFLVGAGLAAIGWYRRRRR